MWKPSAKYYPNVMEHQFAKRSAANLTNGATPEMFHP
jgi:hypothetical protein